MKERLKHIELFAGCGGMSLGLEVAGFDLYFANELSPMAGETFAYNLLMEDLSKDEKPQNVLWIRSQFEATNLKSRLRENPFEASKGKVTDIGESSNLEGKLLIGDINHLLEMLKTSPQLAKRIKDQNIDLVSGGPPCQSFSLAGKREKDNYKNTLPQSFAEICGLIRPKTVLLENVKGITAPFTENGEKYYAWLEVAKAFVLQGYIPVCMMLNSKYFGVPQNRPRFIMFAYRKDVFEDLHQLFQSNPILDASFKFFNKVATNVNSLDRVTTKDLRYYEITSQKELFDGAILPKISTNDGNFLSTKDAIEDLLNTKEVQPAVTSLGKYPLSLTSTFQSPSQTNGKVLNHEIRKHAFRIRSRFRFYQVIEKFQNGLRKGAINLLTGKEVAPILRDKILREFSNHELLFQDKIGDVDKLMKPKDIQDVESLMELIPTKKHSQRALRECDPAPAQLTIPDDLCHYDPEQTRTLTVREMARLQSFPDWFVFRSKITTGGVQRKFEVPQYTQVGNAVPPLLAKALGETIQNQLDRIKNGKIQSR